MQEAAGETKMMENAVVAAVVVLADSHKFPKQLEFLRSTRLSPWGTRIVSML